MREIRRRYIRSALYVGVAFAALGATSAIAQSAPQAATPTAGADKAVVLAQADQTGQSSTASNPSATEVEGVQVYGFRKAQATALKIKQHSDTIVEVVTSEDIGKLPDESIADSLARLPGLASQRDNNGRWQDISVDGLPPSMSTTLFNGFMQATTDNNRVTQFDQYPAEILNQVTVYKTGEASLTNNAIATVDMQTLRPLDYGKTTLAIGAQGEYDTRGKLQPGAIDLGYRVNATYITNWNDKIGLMLGYSHMLAPNQIYAQHPYGFNQPDYVVTGLQDQVRSDALTRDGFVATLQWKPTDKLEFTVDGFLSDYDDHAIIRGDEIQTACCGNATEVGTPSPGVSSWIVEPQILNYDYDDKAKLRSVDFTAKYDLAPGWRLTADYGYSDANRTNQRIELYSGFGVNGMQNTSTATLTAGAGAEGMIGISNWSENLTNLSNIALGENLNWEQWYPPASAGVTDYPIGSGPIVDAGGSAYFQAIHSDDVIQQADLRLNHEFSGFFLSNVEVGISYNVRHKDYLDNEGVEALVSENESQPIPASFLEAPTNMSAFGLPDTISIDPVKAIASGDYAYFQNVPSEFQAEWWVGEKVFTPYIEARIDTNLMGRPLKGNIGVQGVHTEQTVTNYAASGNYPDQTFEPFSVTQRYWEILPSLNLNWQVADTQYIRLGVDRSMARPRFDQMGGNTTFGYNVAEAGCKFVPGQNSGCSSPWSGTLANPNLKPWLSDDVNLAYEYYFAPGEGLSVEGFYKNLESFIYDAATIGNFQAIYQAGSFPPPTPATFYGPVTQFINGNGGRLLGVTLAANVSLKHLWSGLDGFGISATGTYVDSNVHIPDPGTSPTGKIPELSRYIFNVSLYYEKNGWSLRFNDRFRSSYVQEVPNFNGSLQAIEGARENTIDIQAGYQFREGRFKGLAFSISAENVTDTPMNSFVNGDPRQPEYYKLFGTNLLFGASYRY
ncbi:MAG TPA: TonB-dependent receptor [Caulobacteraceae bacterium]|jgi:iron complex outermembrane receptor protein